MAGQRAWSAARLKRPFRLIDRLNSHTGMSPRKKSKPNPKADADSNSTGPELPADASTPATSAGAPTPTASGILQDAPSNASVADSSTSDGAPTPSTSSGHTVNKKPSRKWLGGSGSWRSKAPAIVKTAKESIGVNRGSTSELPGEDAKKPKDQSPTKFLTKRKSSKGDAIPAAMTKLNVSSEGAIDQVQEQTQEDAPKEQPQAPTVDEPPLPPDPPKTADAKDAAGTWGWRSWWSRPDGHPEAGKTTDDARRTPLPGATPSEEPNAASKELGNGKVSLEPPPPKQDVEMKDAPAEAPQGQDTEMKDAPPASDTPPKSTSSWFWLWSSTQNAQTNASVSAPTDERAAPQADGADATAEVQQPQEPEPTTVPPANNAKVDPSSKEAPEASGWAFWFRAKPKTGDVAAEGASQKHVGEVAVFDTPSQSRPEAAQFNEELDPKKFEPKKDTTKEQLQPPAEEPITKRSFRSLRGRPKNGSKDTPTDTPSSSKTVTPSNTIPAPSPTRPETGPAAQPAPKQAPKAKQEPDNLILPEFKQTYHMVQQPSFWQQLRQYFLGGESAMPHLHINPAPPRIKKAVAIGVHGFFPAPIFQKVIGQPKGTSIRFANAAASAVQDWCETRGYSPDVEQIALEGEGFVADRVKTLWKLLLNWIEHIKQADFILVACHSQGVPVAVMLVAKLIQFGCVNATRIGICAMAGVNMGPFMEYKTKYFGRTAEELFEFSNPNSLQSQMYLASLDEVLRHGVRILYVGSIDDQLVSLDSSTFSTLSHPYIYRAVFVDGRIHAPDFITHLVGFALKLRNLGLPDHGLIRELSPALAGSLYGGEGHSRVYEDPRVYHLAVQHALETTSLPIHTNPEKQRPGTSASFAGINIPVPGAKYDAKDVYKLRVGQYHAHAASGGAAGTPNPYFLPWAMRGLLEEEFVKKELGREVEDLLRLFEEWKPTGKGLKDVKFRLEGVRSKL